MSIWHQRLAEADISAREPRRPFDVAAGLRRLAREAGYLEPTATEPRSSHARHRLALIAHWTVTEAGAAEHVEELTELIGDDGTGELNPADFDGWTDAVDIHGVHVFACILFLANHPESALFWWQFAAGATHPGAAYCLYLHHLSMGETREAAFWKEQMSALRDDVPAEFDGSAEEFTEELIDGLESFTCYSARHRTARPRPPRGLEKRFERLAHRQDDGGLVCRPDRELPDQIQELAAQR
ncbi:hypothetical protein [Streptomyces marianii]|uniref:Uncharacterized protein n=1 Tax=Streptomyces marianii TaxID=1817406 RepID=A0A5R9E066_9ACTN|nr:hypothetical protein [Streptomyces marianii]TLQ43056.1 hypothetical protein FEF34_07770 [Streptomyces marianii]